MLCPNMEYDPNLALKITEITDYRGRDPKFLLSFPLEDMVSRYLIQSAIGLLYRNNVQILLLFSFSFMMFYSSDRCFRF